MKKTKVYIAGKVSGEEYGKVVEKYKRNAKKNIDNKISTEKF